MGSFGILAFCAALGLIMFVLSWPYFPKRPEWIHEQQGSHDKHRSKESMGDHTPNMIGVDISKTHLDAHALPSGRAARFSNNAAGFKKLAAWAG